ncbi:hypothetical protein ACHAWT_002794 [Skeletonema menzelii]|mmetsp:Transcript_5889/g.9622  ORF Transcript_5889/g.9622 Transcript_5889/m.9622 type:complete len:444 (+) Transcript_5889:67-1398(+)
MGSCISSTTNALDGNGRKTNDFLATFDSSANAAFTSVQVELWMSIVKYLPCKDIMNLRLASLGIPDAVTLNPRLTGHLVLNLDNCPYIDWIWKKGSDNENLARKWCCRDGKIDFPKDITNDEVELFISRGYLQETNRVSFARCRKLTVEWFELVKEIRSQFIEVSLPTSITDSELKKVTRYLKKVDRLNCIGTSALTNYKSLGELSNLRELHFLHNKHLKSLFFLGKLSSLESLSIDGMFNAENASALTPIVDDDVLTAISGIHLRTLVIGTRLDISGLGLLQLSHMHSLESLAMERGAGESLTDNALKILCGLKKLRKLRVTHCELLTDKGLSSLQHLPCLSSLELRGSNFTDEGARQISKVKGLAHLSLIGWEQMTDKGVYYLSKIKSLESLDLRYCHITDSGVEHLRRLGALRDLHLAECSVTSTGRARLRRNGIRVKVS